jgi:hypothetical protein
MSLLLFISLAEVAFLPAPTIHMLIAVQPNAWFVELLANSVLLVHFVFPVSATTFYTISRAHQYVPLVI